MQHPLTYCYLAAFIVGLLGACAVGLAARPFPVKRTLVALFCCCALWALSDFLCNVSVSPEAVRAVGLVFAPAWAAVPFFVVRVALIHVSDGRPAIWGARELLLLVPAALSAVLLWAGWLQPSQSPPTAARGYFVAHSSSWQLLVTGYFLLYTVVAALLLVRARRRSHRTDFDGPIRVLLGASLPAVLVGGAFHSGSTLLGHDAPYVASLLVNAIVGYVAVQTLRQGYFRPLESYRRERDAALATLSRREAVLEALPLGVAIVRPSDAGILYCNGLLEQLAGGDLEAAVARWLLALRERGGDQPVDVGMEGSGAEPGSARILAIRAVPVSFAGEPATLVTAVEVSRQRLLEARLLEAHKLEAIGTLSGGLAHEMNNILAVVLTCAEVLRLELRDREDVADVIEDVVRASHQGRDLTRNLLTYARAGPREVAAVDLNAAVAEAVGLVQRTAPGGLQVEVHLAAGAPQIQADVAQVRQMVLNLCLNAAGALGERGGRVEVCTSAEGDDEVEIRVTDHGCGMSPETLARCQEPLFSTKGPGLGTGLGLPMVAGAVKAHGGTLEIQSRLGEGTCVTIRLPRAEAPGSGRRCPQVVASNLQ